MLTIIVGRAEPHLKEDLCTEELKMMPKELVEFFRVWYGESIDHLAVRTYGPTLLDYVGEMIEAGDLKPSKVKVITEHGVHFYTKDGVLDSSWPYGIFNWS
jgi:hypothetical protein